MTLALRDNRRGLSTLLTPAFMLFGGWIVVSVVLSQDPGTSVRRLALTVCVIAVAATIMLLPKSQHELVRWFSLAALALLAVCYLGHPAGAESLDPSRHRRPGTAARG